MAYNTEYVVIEVDPREALAVFNDESKAQAYADKFFKETNSRCYIQPAYTKDTPQEEVYDVRGL